MSASELQAAVLVQDIERQTASQRRDLLDAAAREAQVIVDRAHDKVRRQQRRALEEMRHHDRERTRQLRAALDTSARHQAAARAQELLGRAWPRLVEALAQRWADPAPRAAWIAALVAHAAARLALQAWVVRHPMAWSDADAQALQTALRRHGVGSPTLQPDVSFEAGLVIEVDGARLDGTPAALLADRSRVEAALLAALLPASPAATGKAPS